MNIWLELSLWAWVLIAGTYIALMPEKQVAAANAFLDRCKARMKSMFRRNKV